MRNFRLLFKTFGVEQSKIDWRWIWPTTFRLMWWAVSDLYTIKLGLNKKKWLDLGFEKDKLAIWWDSTSRLTCQRSATWAIQSSLMLAVSLFCQYLCSGCQSEARQPLTAVYSGIALSVLLTIKTFQTMFYLSLKSWPTDYIMKKTWLSISSMSRAS